jgi:mRNA interferase RelE/StbE
VKVKFESKFAKDLSNIKDSRLLAKIKYTVLECKQAKNLEDIKKLQSYDRFYLILIGEYRIGIEIIDNELVFTRCLHRKDIYRYFP